MPIMKIQKSGNYTTVSNSSVRDTRLSLETRGLLFFALSCADSWHFSVKGMAETCACSINKIKRCLDELKQYGYLTVERVRNDNGTLGEVEYTFFEEPLPNKESDDKNNKKQNAHQNAKKPRLDFPNLEKPNLVLGLHKNKIFKINKIKNSNSKKEINHTTHITHDDITIDADAAVAVFQENGIGKSFAENLISKYGADNALDYLMLAKAIVQDKINSGEEIKNQTALLAQLLRDECWNERTLHLEPQTAPTLKRIDHEENNRRLWQKYGGI